MAKLEGVKVIDMKDGHVERVNYNGEDYMKLVEGEAKAGDLISPKTDGQADDLTDGAFYEFVKLSEYTDEFYVIIDDVGDRGRVPNNECYVFRRESLIPDFTYEGVEYRKVSGRKVQVGDYLVFTSENTVDSIGDVTVNKPYKITGFDSVNDAEFYDDDNDARCPSLVYEDYEIYEKVTELNQAEPTTANESLSFVVTTRQGEAHVVTADDSIVTVSAFVEEYTDSEGINGISTPDLFVPFDNIATITLKGAC